MELVILCLLLGTLSLTMGQDRNPRLSILLCNWDGSRILLLSKSGTDVSASTITSSLPRPVAIDYDPVEEKIYWTDVNIEQIGTMDLRGNEKRILIRLNSRATPDGLALDIRERKLFYTDTGNDIIATMDFNGTRPKTIISRSSGLDQPRAITLDTKQRKIYWTDWGGRPYIATANYDGTNIRKIVTTGLGWPNGLALDPQNNVLFWCDAKTDKIESITVDGRNRTELLYERTAHYFDIVYHDKTLYFTDLRRRAVLSMPAGGGTVTSLSSSLITKPAGLHVITEYTVTDCPPGTHGTYCQYHCGNCSSGPCNNVTGLCLGGCVPGWQGDDCKTECPPNTYGRCHPCGHCAEGSECDRMSGYCPDKCWIGWRGLRCDIPCITGTYGQSCTMCGHCDGGALCDTVSGHCPERCQDGWTGPLCKTALLGQAAGQSHDVVAAVVGSVVVFLVLIIIIIVVAVVFIRRMKKHQGRPQEVDRPPVFDMPYNQPPAYTSQPGTVSGVSYTTNSDQATLVTSEQQPDNVMTFSRPEEDVLQDEKVQRF